MDIPRELMSLLGLKSVNELSLSEEIIGQGGYLSYRRSITISRNGKEPQHVFIKSSDMSRSELSDLQELSSDVCRTECIFYGLMGPVLERIMMQYDIESMFPRVFGHKISDKGTILVMEDMTKQGFSLVDKSTTRIDHVYCVTRTLARAQAAFWIARVGFNYSLDSLLFGPDCPLSGGIKKSGIDFKTMMKHKFGYFTTNLSKFVKSQDDEKTLKDCISKFIEDLTENAAAIGVPSDRDGPIGLIHGDLWFSNFMFKGEGDSMICRLFDWQFWNVGLFGFDLGLLMVTSLTPEVMEQHVDKIPVEFYRTFKEIFETKTGLSVPFSEEAALANMRHAFFFALFWVMATAHPLWEKNPLDVPNMLANLAFIIRTKRVALPTK